MNDNFTSCTVGFATLASAQRAIIVASQFVPSARFNVAFAHYVVAQVEGKEPKTRAYYVVTCEASDERNMATAHGFLVGYLAGERAGKAARAKRAK